MIGICLFAVGLKGFLDYGGDRDLKAAYKRGDFSSFGQIFAVSGSLGYYCRSNVGLSAICSAWLFLLPVALYDFVRRPIPTYCSCLHIK